MTDALKVALDALREALGECDVVRWVEHPDAVRELLKHEPQETNRDTGEGDCAGCGVGLEGLEPHERDCSVMAAWRALGDRRFIVERDVRAHTAAHEQNRCQVMNEAHDRRCRKTSRHEGRHDFPTGTPAEQWRTVTTGRLTGEDVTNALKLYAQPFPPFFLRGK